MDEAAQLGGFSPVWGPDLNGDGSCLFAYPWGQAAGLGFLVSYGRIYSTYVSPPATNVTLPGVAIGSTEAAIFAAYPGRVTSSPHTYDPSGEYLDIAPAIPTEPGHLTRFNTDAGDFVTSFQSGRSAEVQLVEGCV